MLLSIWWADLALWEQLGANALWACGLLRKVSGSAAVFPGGRWEGSLSVPAPGIYMEEDLRMEDFCLFALRPSPRILLTHRRVLLQNEDLLILDKGKAVSGIINSLSWISSLVCCSSTLKSSFLSFVPSSGLHSEQPQVSFMLENVQMTFVVILERQEIGSKCEVQLK